MSYDNNLLLTTSNPNGGGNSIKNKRNLLIDFQRAILITLVILVHVVHFGKIHPNIKESILTFMMPSFLVITGYLVNIDKPLKKFLLYILKIALPYTIMVMGYMILSLYLPVQDGIKSFDVNTVCNVLFVTSIGPYWFFRIMIICGICYYLIFHNRLSFLNLQAKYILLGSAFLAISLFTPIMTAKCAFYYFIGVGIRLYVKDFSKICIGTFWAFIPLMIMLSQKGWRNWATIFVIASVFCFFSISTQLATYPKGKLKEYILYIGRNTLPIYIFHPIFTMLAKFALPAFQFDSTGCLHAVFTIVLGFVGSLGIAWCMDKTRLSYIFGYKKILR